MAVCTSPISSGTASIVRHKSASLHAMDATLHRRLWPQTNCTLHRTDGACWCLHDSGAERIGTRRLTWSVLFRLGTHSFAHFRWLLLSCCKHFSPTSSLFPPTLQVVLPLLPLRSLPNILTALRFQTRLASLRRSLLPFALLALASSVQANKVCLLRTPSRSINAPSRP
jgi:hypothetical protein